MKLSDRLSGLAAVVLGLAVGLYAQTFPPMPGQDIGPSLFPSLVAAGLVCFGAWLIVADVRSGSTPWVTFDDWTTRRPMVVNFVLVVGALIVYILIVEPVGFFLTSIAFLTILMAAFGASRKWLLPVAVAVTLVMHYGFYTLLRVPLPWGVFQGLAW